MRSETYQKYWHITKPESLPLPKYRHNGMRRMHLLVLYILKNNCLCSNYCWLMQFLHMGLRNRLRIFSRSAPGKKTIFKNIIKLIISNKLTLYVIIINYIIRRNPSQKWRELNESISCTFTLYIRPLSVISTIVPPRTA